MIEQTAVLVIDDHKKRGVAKLCISPNGVENSLNERLALFYVVVGMLVAGGIGRVSIAARRIRKPRLDETVGRKIISSASRKKVIIERAEEIGIAGEAVEGHGHTGILIIKDGVDFVLGESFVDSCGHVAPIDAHIHAAHGSRAVDEGAIRKSGAGHGGKPVVANTKLLRQSPSWTKAFVAWRRTWRKPCTRHPG